MLNHKIKKKITAPADKIPGRKFIFDVLDISILIGLYYAIIARPFFTKTYFFSGDGYHLWSLQYIVLLSIKKFNTLPWWDPIAYNGFPLYYHLISSWTNYLSPFYLPSLILFKIISPLTSINTYYIFNRTLYVTLLNILAIYLISRQLVVNKVAAALTALIFTFSYFQVLNFHDPFATEVMVAPLFYLYALIRYNNKRTSTNLLLLFLFISLYLASLCFGIIMSAIFWSGIFTILLLVFNPSLIKDTFNLILELVKTRKGKIILTLSLLLILAGFLASWLPSHYNMDHVQRYRGGIVNFSDNGLSNNPITIEKTNISTIVSNWIPFPEIQEYLWTGHEYRYIGLVTLPLLLAALILGLKNRYVFILFLTYFLCNGFIIYITDNIAYKILIDNSNSFENVRNMSTIFPRGGPILFLLFLSGIGLDYLIGIPNKSESIIEKENVGSLDKLFIGTLKLLLFCALLATICGILLFFISTYSTRFKFLKHTVFHIGFYLAMFSFLCWVLFLSPNAVVKKCILICLSILIFTDLTISLSHNIDHSRSFIKASNINNNSPTCWPHDFYGRIPYQVLSNMKMLIPDNTDLTPISSESENMFPSNYAGGAYHNPWVINSGIKEWLILASRENGQKLLTNWNPKTLRVKKYPEFKFFSNGYYLPFDSIKDLDTDETIFTRKPLFYLHNKELVASQKVAPEIVNEKYDIKMFTFNKTIIKTKTEEDLILCFLDNYDRFWSAYIDDKEVKINRANFCFKAIKLPAGEHTVSWIYNPSPIKIAYLTFYILLAMFLIYYIFFFRRNLTSLPNSI